MLSSLSGFNALIIHKPLACGLKLTKHMTPSKQSLTTLIGKRCLSTIPTPYQHPKCLERSIFLRNRQKSNLDREIGEFYGCPGPIVHGSQTHDAAWFKESMERKIKEIETELEKDADINLINSKGKTALHLAIESRANQTFVGDFVQFFLKNGATVENEHYVNGSVFHTLIGTYRDVPYSDEFAIQLTSALQSLAAVADLHVTSRQGTSLLFSCLQIGDPNLRKVVMDKLKALGCQLINTEAAHLKIQEKLKDQLELNKKLSI